MTTARANLTPLLGSRPRRVAGLLGLVAFMSLVDLAVTLGFMTGAGMYEGNPIVRFIASSTGSGLAIGLFKALTVSIAVTLVYWVRHRREGELAAWCMVTVLGAVSLQWMQYCHGLSDRDTLMLLETMSSRGLDGWVML